MRLILRDPEPALPTYAPASPLPPLGNATADECSPGTTCCLEVSGNDATGSNVVPLSWPQSVDGDDYQVLASSGGRMALRCLEMVPSDVSRR